MAELRSEGLSKSYGAQVVLADVDLVVPHGTLTAILGASGSGKTTLLRLLVGFVAADRGRVSIGGEVVADAGRIHVAPDKRAIGYVAQEGALFPHLTVAENVGFGLPRSERTHGRRIDEALELVGLESRYAARHPHQLSGGEQRRVALARALAPRPALVLLDEPFSGLDAGLRAETRAAVLEAMHRVEATGVLVTHDQAEALSMGREVGVLRAGRLVQTASPVELYRTPADLGVARFVGEAVVVVGEARSGTVVCTFGRLAVHGNPIDGPVEVMIRPEQIRVDRRTERMHGEGASAKVLAQSFYGPDTVLHLELAADPGSIVTARMFGDDLAGVGENVTLLIEGSVSVYAPSAAWTR